MSRISLSGLSCRSALLTNQKDVDELKRVGVSNYKELRRTLGSRPHFRFRAALKVEEIRNSCAPAAEDLLASTLEAIRPG